MVLIYNSDFQVFSKNSINLKLKIIKKIDTHPTLVILQKNPSLIKIFKSFHQFLSMYGCWLYCRRLPKTHNFFEVIATLRRTLVYIFCKVSLHTNVTQLSIHWKIPSLKIMALQVDFLHTLLFQLPIQIWIHYVIYKLAHGVNHLTCSDILQWGSQQSQLFCMSLCKTINDIY